MLTPTDHTHDRLLRALPFVHNLLIGQTHHQIPEFGGEAVTLTVAFEPVGINVIPAAVHFQNQAGSDQEVHAPDAGDLVLGPYANPLRSQSVSCHRLDAGLGPITAIHQTPNPLRSGM